MAVSNGALRVIIDCLIDFVKWKFLASAKLQPSKGGKDTSMIAEETERIGHYCPVTYFRSYVNRVWFRHVRSSKSASPLTLSQSRGGSCVLSHYPPTYSTVSSTLHHLTFGPVGLTVCLHAEKRTGGSVADKPTATTGGDPC
jgi:hypothetical protein